MTLRMTDAPALEDVDEVNLVIREVAVKQMGDDGNDGWEVLRADSLGVDLLDLQNGIFVTLASGRVASGQYQQVRLKLSPGSTIVVNGVEHPLVVPSGMTSGVKIMGPFNVPNGGVIDVALDFDASRSVHLTGSGTYIMNPVVRVMPMAQAGAIKGRVLPTTATTNVYATMANDTLGSAMTGLDGRYQISVLPAGTYSVIFDAPAAYHDSTVTSVNVTAGLATDLGDLTLVPTP